MDTNSIVLTLNCNDALFFYMEVLQSRRRQISVSAIIGDLVERLSRERCGLVSLAQINARHSQLLDVGFVGSVLASSLSRGKF